jgi:hypothetical protein
LCSIPGRVLARRTAVGVADAVLPVVAADEIAARPTVDGRIQVLEQREDLGTEALDIARRHERDGAHPEGLTTARPNLQTGILGRGTGRKRYGEGSIIIPDVLNTHRLPVFGAITPNQAHFNGQGAWISGEHNPAGIGFPFDDSQVPLS